MRRCPALLLTVLGVLSTLQLSAQTDWNATSLTFRPIGVTVNGSTFWTYGSHEGIASSLDGKEWTQHAVDRGTPALLLGLSFPSESFGFGYGTGGALVFTSDGGRTWTAKSAGTETILAASFADSDHGILRTAGTVFLYVSGTLQKITLPKGVPADFTYAPDVAALSPDHMAFTISEGWRSRTGFVYTNDGGKTWQFFEPPHVIVYQLFRVGDRYWSVGTETIDWDKPGGGYGVPTVLNSQNGLTWQHTPADVHPCHWEGCHSCNVSGCLASGALLIRPFIAPATLSGIPPGPLTTNWAATRDRICAVDANIACAPLTAAGDVSKPGPALPPERPPSRLADAKGKGLLRCIACNLDPIFVDASASGVYKVHLRLVVGYDGIPDEVALENTPSPVLEERMSKEIKGWLFEPPVKDGKSIRISTSTELTIRVVRPPR